VTWNARAIRCYEKAGFRKVRRLPESELREGKWHDEWVMSVSRRVSGRDPAENPR
jgi:aminoglycoside 6'-N-acetyltransferase